MSDAIALDADIAAIAAAAPSFDETIPPAVLRAAIEAAPIPAVRTELGRVEELSIPGPAGPLRARLYATDAQIRPLIVFWHGGGWVLCSIETHDALCRALAAASGCAILSVDYRLAPEHKFPAAPDDAIATMIWAAENASRLGCRGGAIALAGDSAGANLAVAASLAAASHGVALSHLLLFYPPLDPGGAGPSHTAFAEAPMLSARMMQWFWQLYLRPGDDMDPRAAPTLAGSLTSLPATTVILAEYDPLRSDGEAFAARLRAAGCTVELRLFTGVCHGFASLFGLVAKAAQAVDYAGARLQDAFLSSM